MFVDWNNDPYPNTEVHHGWGMLAQESHVIGGAGDGGDNEAQSEAESRTRALGVIGLYR